MILVKQLMFANFAAAKLLNNDCRYDNAQIHCHKINVDDMVAVNEASNGSGADALWFGDGRV
ncbi:hypothetical protein [Ferrimonas senticii]|uniref:hypothetical protein n=1 Tax=Ferrimonas senticii TaxID=394566 RepID=UPI00041FF099|nr:hypothetical protein [Ferrimonas senticii]